MVLVMFEVDWDPLLRAKYMGGAIRYNSSRTFIIEYCKDRTFKSPILRDRTFIEHKEKKSIKKLKKM